MLFYEKIRHESPFFGNNPVFFLFENNPKFCPNAVQRVVQFPVARLDRGGSNWRHREPVGQKCLFKFHPKSAFFDENRRKNACHVHHRVQLRNFPGDLGRLDRHRPRWQFPPDQRAGFRRRPECTGGWHGQFFDHGLHQIAAGRVARCHHDARGDAPWQQRRWQPLRRSRLW